MNPFEKAWRILKEQSISPDIWNRYTQCPVCRIVRPTGAYSGTDICSPECEHMMEEMPIEGE